MDPEASRHAPTGTPGSGPPKAPLHTVPNLGCVHPRGIRVAAQGEEILFEKCSYPEEMSPQGYNSVHTYLRLSPSC